MMNCAGSIRHRSAATLPRAEAAGLVGPGASRLPQQPVRAGVGGIAPAGAGNVTQPQG